MRLLNDKVELAERLMETGSVDLSYSLQQRARFRVNVFSQRGTYSIVLRVIANEIPTFDDLGLPPQLAEIANEHNGIVLVTGPTGSGRSTSLAVIDKMNRERAIHIFSETLVDASTSARNAAGWEMCLANLELLVDGTATAEFVPEVWTKRFEHYAAAFQPQFGPQQGPPEGHTLMEE